MEIRVEADELERFAVRLRGEAARCTADIALAIKKSTLSIRDQAMRNLTSNGSVKTGHLKRSIAHKLTQDTGIVHTSNVEYAIVVEKGSKAHTIKPKNKKALYWQGARHPVKSVRHPGTRPKPYLLPALEAEKPKFLQNLRDAIQLD